MCTASVTCSGSQLSCLQVVCHWNEGTPALLRQLASAQRSRKAFGDAVVVLADRGKKGMDLELTREARRVFLRCHHTSTLLAACVL